MSVTRHIRLVSLSRPFCHVRKLYKLKGIFETKVPSLRCGFYRKAKVHYFPKIRYEWRHKFATNYINIHSSWTVQLLRNCRCENNDVEILAVTRKWARVQRQHVKPLLLFLPSRWICLALFRTIKGIEHYW